MEINNESSLLLESNSSTALDKLLSQLMNLNATNYQGEQKCILLVQNTRDLFSSSEFYVQEGKSQRQDFFMRVSEIVLEYTSQCIKSHVDSNEEFSFDQLRSRIKYPAITLCMIFCYLLETGEAIPTDILLLLDRKFASLDKPSIYIAYFLIISSLLKEINLEDEVESPPSTATSLEEETNPNKIRMQPQTLNNFMQLTRDLLLLYPFELVRLSSQNSQNIASNVELLQISLRILIQVLQISKSCSKQLVRSFMELHRSELKIIISCFVEVLQILEQSKSKYLEILQSMLEFIYMVSWSVQIEELYWLMEDSLVYLLKHFNGSNPAVDYYDINQQCMYFLIDLQNCYLSNSVDICAFPLMLTMYERSAFINLLTFENQQSSLSILTRLMKNLVNLYSKLNTSSTSNSASISSSNSAPISTPSCAINVTSSQLQLNQIILQYIQVNTNFLFQRISQQTEFEDQHQFIENLSEFMVLSIIIDQNVYFEFLKNALSIMSTDLTKYFTIEKYIMKKYLYHCKNLSRIYKNFCKSEDFLLCTRYTLEGFKVAQEKYVTLELSVIAEIEKKIQFFQDLGSKLFNMRVDALEESGILEIFCASVLNPLSLLNSAVLSKVSSQIFTQENYCFYNICFMMTSVRWFQCFDLKDASTMVFKVETEPSFVKNILSFCSEIRSAISNVQFWTDPSRKTDRKRVKNFYKSSIYWILLDMEQRGGEFETFDNYFIDRDNNIFILNSIFKELSDKVLPEKLLTFLKHYLKQFTQSGGFCEILQTYCLCNALMRFMINVSMSVPSKANIEFSGIEYCLKVYLNQSCLWMKHQLQNCDIHLLTPQERELILTKQLNLLTNLNSVLFFNKKFYLDNSEMSLKRNYFLHRVFWLIINILTLTDDKETIMSNKRYKTMINEFIKLAISHNLEFLEKEESDNQNATFFNFILEILTSTKYGNDKLTHAFCQSVLSYFRTENKKSLVIQLAQNNEIYKKVVVEMFGGLWRKVLDMSLVVNASVNQIKEEEAAQMVDFVLKFAACLDNNFLIFNSQILQVIQNHPFFGCVHQDTYNIIIQSLVFKNINGVDILKNFFPRNLLKNLITQVQTLNQYVNK